MKNTGLDSHNVEPLAFRGGLTLLGAFIAFMAIFLAGWTAYVTPTLHQVFGLSSTDPWRVVLNVFPGAIMLSVGYGVLHLEGIRARKRLALYARSRRHQCPSKSRIARGCLRKILVLSSSCGKFYTSLYRGPLTER